MVQPEGKVRERIHGNFGDMAFKNHVRAEDIVVNEEAGLALVSLGDGSAAWLPLPASGLNFLGVWNATTNSPTITSGVGSNGDYYIVGTAGTTLIDGINDWGVSDWIIFNGTAWQKIDNSEATVLASEVVYTPTAPFVSTDVQGALDEAAAYAAAFDAHEAALDPHTAYLLVNGTRAMTGNLNMGAGGNNIINTADITSNADATRSIGTNANRYLEMVGVRVRGIDNGGTGTRTFTMASGTSGGMFGFAYAAAPGDTAEISLSNPSPNFRPAFIAGLAYASAGGTARLRNTFGGATVIGSAFSNGGVSLLETTSYGAFAGGYAFSPGAGASTVRGAGSGAFVWGYAVGSTAASSVIAAGAGSFVAARCGGSGTGAQLVETTAPASGGFAAGIIEAGPTTSASGTIRVSAVGGFAQGRVQGGTNASASGLLLASGAGSFAQGFVTGGTAAAGTSTITASGQGSFAHGSAVAGAAAASIIASGLGSFAVGAAASGETITASATNAFQFGVGTNATANSLQVGANFRANGSGQHAGIPQTLTLGAAAATFAITSQSIRLTGNGGGNNVTTITGAISGQFLAIEFQDGNVTIVNDDTHAANTIDLVGAANLVGADDTMLFLYFNGTSWYEVARSVN